MLALKRAANAGELGAGVVGEVAVGVDPVAELAEERGEVAEEDGLGEGGDGGPARGDGGGGLGGESAPGLGELGEVEDLEELGGLEGGAGDAGFGEEIAGVEEAGEGEWGGGGEEGAELVDAVLLEVDPGEVDGGFEGDSAGAAGGGLGAAGDELAEAWPLECGGGALAQGCGTGGYEVFGVVFCCRLVCGNGTVDVFSARCFGREDRGLVGVNHNFHGSRARNCLRLLRVADGAWERSVLAGGTAMICTGCGMAMEAGARFCPRCGATVLAASAAGRAAGQSVYRGAPGAPWSYPSAPVVAGRVARNLRPLALLWIVYAALRACGGVVGLLVVSAVGTGHYGPLVWMVGSPVPAYLRSGEWMGFAVPAIILSTLLSCGLALVAGLGLLRARRWGRPLAIVAAVLAMLQLPLGTALGVYTLWVLASSRAGSEYEGLAGGA